MARELNQATWDQRAAIHGQDRYYDLAGFLAGANPLREVELALCDDVAGKDLLHLQRRFGLDTLGWARLGARAAGLDFSPAAISRARDLARQAQLPASFVEVDVLDPPVDLAGLFDRWLPPTASSLRSMTSTPGCAPLPERSAQAAGSSSWTCTRWPR